MIFHYEMTLNITCSICNQKCITGTGHQASIAPSHVTGPSLKWSFLAGPNCDRWINRQRQQRLSSIGSCMESSDDQITSLFLWSSRLDLYIQLLVVVVDLVAVQELPLPAGEEEEDGGRGGDQEADPGQEVAVAVQEAVPPLVLHAHDRPGHSYGDMVCRSVGDVWRGLDTSLSHTWAARL